MVWEARLTHQANCDDRGQGDCSCGFTGFNRYLGRDQ